MIMEVKAKLTRIAALTFLTMALILTAVKLPAQESRKVLSNPAPVYPEIARKLLLTGVVKVQIVIAPDGKIKSTNVVGGHPVLVKAVEDALKISMYAPASSETSTQLEFYFHP